MTVAVNTIRQTALIICALVAIFAAKAQDVHYPDVTQTLMVASDTLNIGEASSTPVISVLTCAPGREVYQLEGHTGLRMQWDGHDVVANWGVFDFDSPNFVYRFVKGQTDYCIAIHDTPRFLYPYMVEERCVTEQVINLTDTQAKEVVRLVLVNAQPENRVYRYNYVYDNCATRPLSIIQRAIGDSISLGKAPENIYEGTTLTFRNEMRHYHANYPWYQLGIDLALGSGLDKTVADRNATFAPHALALMLSNADIIDPLGGKLPLVTYTTDLLPGQRDGNMLPATPWYLAPSTIAVLLLLVTLAISRHDRRRRHISRWFDAIFYFMLAIAGCVITFLVFISEHEASSPNYHLYCQESQ